MSFVYANKFLRRTEEISSAMSSGQSLQSKLDAAVLSSLDVLPCLLFTSQTFETTKGDIDCSLPFLLCYFALLIV